MRLVVLFLLSLAASPAAAESLVTVLSAEEIRITSNFTGAEIAIFGTLRRDAQTVARSGPYRVAATVIGPPMTATTRERERTFGIWINRGGERLRRVPSFYAALSDAAFTEIAGEALRRSLKLGLDVLPIGPWPDAAPAPRSPYEAAFIRLMSERALYVEDAAAVEFLTPEVFRAEFAIPANVPIGTYRLTIHLFSGGVLLASNEHEIRVGKVGFEEIITEAARDNPIAYGLLAVFLATLVGWVAGVVFRRD